MIEDAVAFIKEECKPIAIPFLDNMVIYQAEMVETLWDKMMSLTGCKDMPPPLWAFPWAGGMGLARYVLDNPEIVRGKSVLDFASGSGIVGIAASRSGARKLRVCDIDPAAQVVAQMNAELNNVRYKEHPPIYLKKPVKGFDVILAGDVFFEPKMSHEVGLWLRLCAEEGTTVLVGDPGRAYMPTFGVDLLARYVVPTSKATEYTTTRDVQIMKILPS